VEVRVCGGGGWGSACFFFSSRRRHTRFSRDWSSDVCSSDLPRGRDRDGRWQDRGRGMQGAGHQSGDLPSVAEAVWRGRRGDRQGDRKSTRLNSSHVKISYAVFCLKKKNQKS